MPISRTHSVRACGVGAHITVAQFEKVVPLMSPEGEEGIGNQLERDHPGNGLLYRNYDTHGCALAYFMLDTSPM